MSIHCISGLVNFELLVLIAPSVFWQEQDYCNFMRFPHAKHAIKPSSHPEAIRTIIYGAMNVALNEVVNTMDRHH